MYTMVTPKSHSAFVDGRFVSFEAFHFCFFEVNLSILVNNPLFLYG